MTNRLMATVLIFFLLPSMTWAKTKTPQEQVLRLKPGTTVEVRLKTEQTLRGKLGQVTDGEFELTQNHGATQKFAFADVQSVRQAASKKKIAAFVILGTAGTGALLFGLAMHEVSNAVWHFKP